MIKRFFAIAIVMFLTLAVQAQRFDWVRTFSGPPLNTEDIHRPVSSVTDTEGNIYLIGEFTPGARIGNSELLPIAGANNMCALIAKFTSSGELAWHKAIYSQQSYCYALDIRKQGDTAVVVMGTFRLPYEGGVSDNNNVYYLDTLLTTTDSYLMTTDSIANYTTNFFITLDYDGNVIEQHFLQMAYVDSSGATLRRSNTGQMAGDNKIITTPVSDEMFNIDNEGNIYVCRRAVDVYSGYNTAINDYVVLSVENGGIGQLRILIDGQRSQYFQPSYRTDHRNQQILKFSPHFDSLLDAVYVFDSLTIPQELYTNINVSSFEKGGDDNFYLLLGGWDYPDTMMISRSNDLECVSNNLTAFDACMIEYSTDMTATRVIQISCTEDPLGIPKSYYFHGATYDKESNSIYLLGSVQKTPMTVESPNCWITYRNDTLDLNRNLFWLRIDPTDNSLIAYGKARTNNVTRIKQTDGIFQQSNIVVSKNRVFSQVGYQGDIFFRDTSIDIGITGHGIGVMWWDIEGHELGFLDYNAISIENKTGRLHLVDSSLYLTGIVASSADFGERHIDQAGGCDQAYIACYVDTSFITPSVYIDPRKEQIIEWNQELSFPLNNTPIILTAAASSGLPVTYNCADTTIARVIDNTLYLLAEGTTMVTACQSGTEYGYYPAMPVSKVLTVNDVGVPFVNNEKEIGLYPNPTNGRMIIDIDNEQIIGASIISTMGQRKEIKVQGNVVSLADIPSGIYYIQITTDRNTYQQKIIKL